MHNQIHIYDIIACLEDVLQRPGVYLGTSIDVTHVVAFLNGFDAACVASGLSGGYVDAVYQSVVRERGWGESSTRGIWNSMRDRGLPEDEIVRELLLIEIATWKRRATLPFNTTNPPKETRE
jgi:hypothetical protein